MKSRSPPRGGVLSCVVPNDNGRATGTLSPPDTYVPSTSEYYAYWYVCNTLFTDKLL